VSGEGYSLLWYEGDDKFVELPWRHGFMYTPPFWMFHQHFNTCAQPARYLACSIGSARYPFISLRRVSNQGGGSTSVKQTPSTRPKWPHGLCKPQRYPVGFLRWMFCGIEFKPDLDCPLDSLNAHVLEQHNAPFAQ
jgi:hypothetical protein